MDQSKWGVHEGHCCALHGCKYGDEDCPVVSGETQQEYLCESCEDNGIRSIDEVQERARHIEDGGCDRCEGDVALYWQDSENNAFVDSKGEVLVTAKDHTMRFNVDRCPHCGRLFKR